MRSTRLQEIKPERSVHADMLTVYVRSCHVTMAINCIVLKFNIKVSNSLEPFVYRRSQSNASKELTAAIRYYHSYEG